MFQTCVESLGLDVEESREISDKFDGFGPNMYTMTVAGWDELLGSKHRGCGVWSSILSMRDKKGAVPKNVWLKATVDAHKRAAATA